MKLFVVRHGECEANAQGIVAGSQNDSPLTERGAAQAAETGQRLKGFQGIIVSSPLQRAYKTAEIIRDIVMPDAAIHVDVHFTERNVGDALGVAQAEYLGMERSGVAIPNAESFQELYNRVRAGLEQLKMANSDIVLVCHSGTARMITCVLEHLPAAAFATMPGLQNAEVKTFDLELVVTAV